MAFAHATTAAALFIILLASSSSAAPPADPLFRCYDSIVNFGDSLSDTGNDLVPGLHTGECLAGNPPNGQAYFHHPTGRFSDGRIIIDFIAQSLGLPLLKPYFPEGNAEAAQRCREFSTGVNFAVSGASALSYDFYVSIGYANPYTTISLGTQVEWFRGFLAGFPDGGRKYAERSLVVVGSVGGNDYNHLLLHGWTLEQMQLLVPKVTSYIASVVQELIELGAVTFLVPGNVPFGCFPDYLTIFEQSSTSNDYDPQIGCLSWLNELSGLHNDLLQKELQKVRELNPHANIMYADFYNAAMGMYRSPKQFGFGNQILRSCCGIGGRYNYNESARCGTPEATCCDVPSEYISWDGIHFTEAANRLISKALLQGRYTDPPFSTICLNSTSNPRGAIADN
ncbi:GDSL esterase/lipase At1g28570-like [Andrographis paniculata]|uniref:GDSL esterase/lipase At1g28570-like n=1 Tax=Andrographis paniculata TaxID=175694 RepID=UPI0021E6E451|nr:GDSL esterase/lipase At1g28570-like [Andrographis paniculata]